MSGFIKWIRSYPLTALVIISCLIGSPYFAGKVFFEQYQTWQKTQQCVDVLENAIKQYGNGDSLFQLSAQKTEAQRQEEIKKAQGPFSKVDIHYFDDAVFIGDSRTDTLKLYAGWDQATYYVKTGTNIWSILNDEVAPDVKTGELMTIDEALQKYKFGKVYIMLGVNELGTGTPETYYQQFKKVVERIRELQPEALIFVESIIHVSQSKDAEGTAINNKEINARNKWLKKLANQENVFYLDANEVLDDEKGALKASLTFDGVHLKADQLKEWKEYFLSHGVVQD